jgi:hypothetical protein
VCGALTSTASELGKIVGNESKLDRPIMMRHGVFDDYAIYGNLFEEWSGRRYWILNLVQGSTEYSESSEHSYWVSGDEFRSILEGKLLENLAPSSTIMLGEVVRDLPLAERQAALKAIGIWEYNSTHS